MQDMPASVTISFLVAGVVLVGWMVFGFREYRRTGRATWLLLGVLMGVSLLAGFLRFPR
jgi:purine-cytosine permease-like protein